MTWLGLSVIEASLAVETFKRCEGILADRSSQPRNWKKAFASLQTVKLMMAYFSIVAAHIRGECQD